VPFVGLDQVFYLRFFLPQVLLLVRAEKEKNIILFHQKVFAAWRLGIDNYCIFCAMLEAGW
jgi:hypothetical protein